MIHINERDADSHHTIFLIESVQHAGSHLQLVSDARLWPMEELMIVSVKLRYIGLAAGLFVGTAVSLVFPAVSTALAQIPQQAAISEEASAALARMNKTLTAPQFSFRARTVRAYAGPNGELLHVAHTLKTVVKRPDRLSVDSTGDDGSRKVFFDGKNLVIYGADRKEYANIPVPGKIDEMLQVAEDRFGVDFPLADLLSNNPENSLLTGVTSGGQVGTAMIDSVRCRHFFFIQSPDLELELWLEDNEGSLPRRLFVTYRSLPGHPTFLAELSDWDFSIKPNDAEFVFQPPAGVTEIEMKARPGAAPAAAK